MKKTIVKGIKVEIPSIPNYLLFRELDGTITPLDIGEFADAELQEIGRLWTQAFIEKANKRRQY